MADNRAPRIRLSFIAVTSLLSVTGYLSLVRVGTDTIADYVSPDGKWDVLLMVRKAGTITDFSTQVSIVRARDPIAREAALYLPGNVFVVDDSHGAVASDHRGRIAVWIDWALNTDLTVSYPAGAHPSKMVHATRGVRVFYSERPYNVVTQVPNLRSAGAGNCPKHSASRQR